MQKVRTVFMNLLTLMEECACKLEMSIGLKRAEMVYVIAPDVFEKLKKEVGNMVFLPAEAKHGPMSANGIRLEVEPTVPMGQAYCMLLEDYERNKR